MKKSKIFLTLFLLSIFLFIPKTYALTPSVKGVRFRYATRALNGSNINFSDFIELPKMIWSDVNYPYMIQPIFEVYTNSTKSNIVNFDEYNQYYIYLSLPGSWRNSNLSCNSFNFELIFYNENTDTFDYFNNSISCVGMKYRTNLYNQDGYSYNAYNLILQMNVPSNFSDSYKIGRISIISRESAFIDATPFQIGLSYFSIDTEYKENFLNISNELMQQQINQNNTIINQNTTIIDQNNQTNNKLDIITDNSNPSLDGLGNTSTWLPQGPVDSIIMLPLNFINTLVSKIGGTCQPVKLPIPFVENKYLTLPCIFTLFNQIENFSTLYNLIGVIGSVYLLYNYLIRFYKWIDDTLSFRENNWQDWGGD